MDKKNYRFSMVATDSGKTRISCSRCRKKNMVCDKLMPSCTNCMKRGLNCSYPLRKQWTRRETKELEKKEKESKKRQKRLETGHSTKKKKLSHTKRGASSEFEDVSSSLSSLHKDPLFDLSPPTHRSASETELCRDEPSLYFPPTTTTTTTITTATSPLGATTQHSPINSPRTSSSPFQSSPLSNPPLNAPSTSSPLSSPMGATTGGGGGAFPPQSSTFFSPTNPTNKPFARSLSLLGGSNGLTHLHENTPSISSSSTTTSPNPMIPALRPRGTTFTAGTHSTLYSKTNSPRSSTTNTTNTYNRPGNRASFGFARAPTTRTMNQSPSGGNSSILSSPLSPLSSAGGKGSLPPLNSLPGMKEVFETTNKSSDERTLSPDSGGSSPFSDSFPASTLSNPFSSPVSNASPSSPSLFSPSPSFGIRNGPPSRPPPPSSQLPLSPLSSLTISTPSQQPPPRPFMLSSMMNATFPPPSTSMSPSISSLPNTLSPNAPSLLSQLPPLLPSNSLTNTTISPGLARSTNLTQTSGGSLVSSTTPPMGYVLSSSTPPFLPRHSSADLVMNNGGDGALTSPPETPSPSQSSWSSSAPLFPPGTPPTSPPMQAEEVVITAQEHAFFEEMGWFTLTKDNIPHHDTTKTTPTTTVVRSSLSDQSYQTQLVENCKSPMVSMYFGAYRAPSGDVRVRHPQFVAKNELLRKEFHLSPTKSLKGQYHPVSQRRVFEEMRARFVASPDQVVQELRFGVLIDDRKGNWIEYATCANYFYGVDGLLTYVTRTFVKCAPSPVNVPSIDYLIGKEKERKERKEGTQTLVLKK